MHAANETMISTYGIKTLHLNLGLRRAFQWKFVVTDVAKPIIGADFLDHYGLLVDFKHRQLLDRPTSLKSTGRIAAEELNSIKAIASDSPYHQLLAEYPDLVRSTAIPRKSKHDVHFINTTPRPSTYCKPRMLSAEMYKIAREEFEDLMRQGYIRPSKSQWASALHMVEKGERMEALQKLSRSKLTNGTGPLPDTAHRGLYAFALREKDILDRRLTRVSSDFCQSERHPKDRRDNTIRLI